MRLLSLALAFVPALLTASAEKLDIPQVDTVVQHVLNEYYNYTHYKAPPGTTNSTSTKRPLSPAAAGQPYWYEQISHQGISAFGPSGYSVYRNVKDYGAKGK
jgi:glucan 1,3-beta-glucosidase